MSFPDSIPAAFIETILAPLTALLLAGAGGDAAAAYQAARQTLGSYNAETLDELRLAAEIVCFSLSGIQATGQGARADLPDAQRLRLESSAVRLRQSADRASQRLKELRKARLPEAEPAPAAPAPVPQAPASQAPALAAPAPQVLAATPRPPAGSGAMARISAFMAASEDPILRAYGNQLREPSLAAASAPDR